jgi:DNA repair protein RadA/Sms
MTATVAAIQDQAFIEDEEAVLGAILIAEDAWPEAKLRLTSSTFRQPAHGYVFAACLAVDRSGRPIDPVLVNAQLDAEGLLGSAVPRELVFSLARSVGVIANLSHYINSMHVSAEKRRTDPAGVLSRHAIVPISTVPRERIDWLWSGRFAFGKHTDLSGDPGDGKSLMMMALAAQITKGLALPFGQERVRDPRRVLFLSTEDDAADTIRPRLEAAGGDVSMLFVQKDTKHLILPQCADELGDIIKTLDAGLTVIDPLFSFIGDLDPNAYDSAVKVCDPLKRIASQTRSNITTIRHLNKASGQAAKYRAGGSIGWQAKPRVVLSLGRNPDDRTERVVTSIKGNVGAEPMAATFRIGQAPIDGEDVARILWGAESTMSADQVHGAEGAKPAGPTKAEALADYIRDRLTSAGEAGVLLDDLRDDAPKVGCKGASTFYAAKRRLQADLVEFHADPDAPRSPLRWRLREA